MRAVPAEVAARWGAMWAHGTVLARPWWRMRVVEVWPDRWTREAHYRWERADGKTHGGGTGVSSGGNGRDFFAAPHVYQPNETDMAALAAIDAAHPLPHPGFYPGQVWVLDDDEVTICRVKHRDARVEAYVSPDYGAIDYSKDLLDGAILVAGPTPWGRDCPWSPA